LGSDPIEPQAREVEFLNKGVDRPNRIALIDPVLQALGKQRPLPAIDPLNEAPHLIPPQIAAESYSANQIIQCVFTQLGSDSVLWAMSARCPVCPKADKAGRFTDDRAMPRATLPGAVTYYKPNPTAPAPPTAAARRGRRAARYRRRCAGARFDCPRWGRRNARSVLHS